jgi:hypothetical protein
METKTPVWRQQLVKRLEKSLGRDLLHADFACIVWNDAGGTLTVESQPLLTELRARNLISNIFRCRDFRH